MPVDPGEDMVSILVLAGFEPEPIVILGIVMASLDVRPLSLVEPGRAYHLFSGHIDYHVLIFGVRYLPEVPVLDRRV